MKATFLIPVVLAGFVLSVFTGFAQNQLIYQPHQMQADLEKFKQALIDLHPGTYTHLSQEEYEELVNKLKLEVSSPKTASEFYQVVWKLIAGIHDGHTYAYTFGKLGDLVNNQGRFPFEVLVRNQRIFVIKNLSEFDIPEGSEILSINGKLSNEILWEILEHHSADGSSSNGVYHGLAGQYWPFYKLFPEIFSEHPTYHLAYRDADSREIKSVKVTNVSKAIFEKRKAEKYPLEVTSDEDPFSSDAFSFDIKHMQGSTYAYMKINRFIQNGFNDPEDIYPNFYKSCFSEISQRDVQTLVIDLRENGGGKASNAAYLLQYFVNSSITPAKRILTLGDDSYFSDKTGQTLNLDSAFGLKPEKGGCYQVTGSKVLRELMSYPPIDEHAFKGSLVVLINGGTVSAAAVAAGLLQEFTDAIFVGEETFSYSGISNGIRQIAINGDHTETGIYLPLFHAVYNVNTSSQKRGVVPDYHVSPSVQDVLVRHDVVLDFVERMLFTKVRK